MGKGLAWVGFESSSHQRGQPRSIGKSGSRIVRPSTFSERPRARVNGQASKTELVDDKNLITVTDTKSILPPSKTRDRYWIDSENPTGVWTENSGKWLLFIPASRIDAAWAVIDRETREGRLGVAAKVATAMPNPMATHARMKLICVYTYNFEDLDDVQRVRQRLRELGYTRKIPYKTDAATVAGKYAKNGDKKVSLFYE